ncbi:Peptidase C48 SUMO/Sentrin/Ubl1 [Penicillium brevicompactum]|uniref:Peptidase C48 SUMO/Sentrin/Ubl1 n=1 Tax=Penicillium brevicompactum TaxID=5074 RepID=A0A9W9V390_PENBR|nr:Peptidase C48 SUMO/Sentrin/Ubl1 [Penicillium brevicompactum]KAJ5347858.1 Peptidase C48 SUMO/Sentrin/Ubl1 [Penicillium brevicompactum]KAJ5367283.1 Peptidase C48 SUMO/Sentrin/Ubl1 [Penicillium brevicompactum]
MGLFSWYFCHRRGSASKSPKSSEAKQNPLVAPKLPVSDEEGTNSPDISLPGAFPSTPPESPGLKPIDPYGETTEEAEASSQEWEPMDLDGHTKPALVTDLGIHLHPRWPAYRSRPPTPKRTPPPSPPKVKRVRDDRMEIDDPWQQRAREFSRTPHGPVSAVQLFNPKPKPIPPNRIASWYAPEFEKREKERLARELDRHRPSRVVPRGQPVRSLSPTWLTKVQNAVQCAQSQVIARSLTGDEICQKDIVTCVRPLAWLNDEIINSYLGLLVHYLRELNGNLGPKDKPRFHSFNTFFYSTLRDKGYAGVARWARRAKIGGADLLNVDMVFIPVHEVNHWTLMVVRPADRTIEYFDSLGSAGSAQVTRIKKWLHGELGDQYKEEEWTVLASLSSQQDNMSDCGVFLLMNAKAIALGIEPTAFGPSHTSLLRRKIVAELMNGGLHGEFIPQDPAGLLLL